MNPLGGHSTPTGGARWRQDSIRLLHFRVGALKAGADDEDFHGFRAGCGRFEAFRFFEHPTTSVEEIRIGLAFEDLHHAISPFSKPERKPIEKFITESGGSKLIR